MIQKFIFLALIELESKEIAIKWEMMSKSTSLQSFNDKDKSNVTLNQFNVYVNSSDINVWLS